LFISAACGASRPGEHGGAIGIGRSASPKRLF